MTEIVDDFYAPLNTTLPSRGLASSVWQSVLAAPAALVVTILLSPVFLVVATRLLSGRASEKIKGKNGRTVWMPSYWLPVVGHAFGIMIDPLKFLGEMRDQSAHGIFSLNLGGSTNNFISDPKFVSSIMAQRESVLSFESLAMSMVSKFMGVPKSAIPIYQKCYKELSGQFVTYLLREPALGDVTTKMVKGLGRNIPQMISFVDAVIDLQPWERWANAKYISASETEVNLMSLVWDILGEASTNAIFGSALLGKYPDLLHDVKEMDKGMYYFLMGLPSWFPWPGVMSAHFARARAWKAMDDHQEALDALAMGKSMDSTWGDLDDVSQLVLKRNESFRANNLKIKERSDLSVLWALGINANMLVYWQILYILSTPNLLARIRTETAPYTTITKGLSIGSFSESPNLSLSHEGLCTKCPLLKATYLEALRLTNQPWSVRLASSDVVISRPSSKTDSENPTEPISYLLPKNSYVTVPHELHMRDPKYFTDPDKFIPERFLTTQEDGTQTVDMGTIRPYGGGPSICKGRLFAERECLCLVAGVLAYWDIEPQDQRKGFVIPKMEKTAGVCRPVGDTRVRIRRRVFEWEGGGVGKGERKA